MKLKTLSFLLLIFFFKTSSAQSDTFKILLGENDTTITQYYNSLINLFPDNNYLKIEKDIDNNGNKILKLKLPTIRYGKVGISTIFSRFLRLDNGREICTQQFFICDNSSMNDYLSYVKDNYKSEGLNKWSKSLNEGLKIIAEFKRGEGELSSISFLIKEKTKIEQ